MNEVCYDILVKIEKIIKAKEYNIKEDIDTPYTFYIYKEETPASIIHIIKTDSPISPGKTRSTSKLIHNDVFAITWLETYEGYKCEFLALLLLIYGICILQLRFTNINYIVLDDDSDKSHELMESNIYNSIGFKFRDTIQIDITKKNKIITQGPEKQLEINKEFVNKINILLNVKFRQFQFYF